MPHVRRAFTLAVALATTAAFVLVRNRYDWEDSSFLVALAVFCAAAAVLAAVASLALRASGPRPLLHGAVAAVLVPVLLLAYWFPVTIGMCLLGVAACSDS
jgi:hypothetical protein